MRRKKDHQRKLVAESLETRRCLAASLGWDGPGQGSAELSYYVGSAPSGISPAQFESTIESALDVWSDVIDVSFVQTSCANQLNSLDFSSRSLDGSGGTLAQAYFPDDVNPDRIAGNVEFDNSENWEIGNSSGGRAFDLLQVAVHEVGHALGIDHLNVSGSVLAPFVSASQSFRSLSTADVDAALALYAPAKPTELNSASPSDSTVNVPPTNDNNADNSSENSEDPAEETGEEDTPSTNPNFRPWQRHGRRYGFWFRIGGRMIAAPNQHNAVQPTDVNQDGKTTSGDALSVINRLIHPDADPGNLLADTNGDGFISGRDAVFVINEIFRVRTGGSPTPGVMTEFESPSEEGETDDHVDETIDNEPTDVETNPPTETETGDGGEPEDTGTETVDPGADQDSDGGVDDPTDSPGLHPAIEKLFDFADANDDGELTDGEVPSFIWRHLSKFDADENGAVTKYEVETYIQNRSSRGFDRLDDNGDGSISQDEVNASIWNKLVRADGNDDGLVTEAELDEYRQSRPSKAFRKLDDNDDGLITENEVGTMAWSFLVMLDADASGSITSDELPKIPRRPRHVPVFPRFAFRRIPFHPFRF